MNSDEPKACPFCRANDSEIIEVDLGRFAVACSHCGAIGPTADGVAGALTVWSWACRPGRCCLVDEAGRSP
jgi:hypothetical protein